MRSRISPKDEIEVFDLVFIDAEKQYDHILSLVMKKTKSVSGYLIW